MNSPTFIPLQSLFGRWIIAAAENQRFAWSGRRFVPIDGYVQISNFATRDEAIAYAKEFGLELAANSQLPKASGEVHP